MIRIRSLCLSLCCAFFICGQGGAQTPVQTAAATPDRPPVLLREHMLQPPIETTGTGLAPEVKVRVSLDERGRIDHVEMLSIRPSTEYDELFERDLERKLKHWRYAPAIVEGQPAAATLEWTVQFRALSGNVNAPTLLPPILGLKEDAEARHASIMGLPFEKRKEILLRYSEIAEKHLDKKHRQQFSGARFVVVTDTRVPDSARILAQALDAAMGFIHRFLEPRIEPQPSKLKILVYIYSDRSSFDAMRRDLLPLTCTNATYYAPGLIVYHLEVSSTDYLLSFLIHEASHAYSDHHLRRPGFILPRWLEEGFAEYMGNSHIKKGELVPGRVLKRKYVLNHFAPGATLARTVAGWDLERVKKALQRGEGLRLEEVVAAERDIFYGDDSYLYYGTSWLFVHFLRHGKPRWAEESFPLLMLYLAEGYPAIAALEAAYDLTIAELEAPFLAYVKKF